MVAILRLIAQINRIVFGAAYINTSLTAIFSGTLGPARCSLYEEKNRRGGVSETPSTRSQIHLGNGKSVGEE
jgi:hypothetical protein